MAIPETTNALREAGWEYSGEATCRGCGERIEWWITPSGKNMPVSVKGCRHHQNRKEGNPRVALFGLSVSESIQIAKERMKPWQRKHRQ